MAKPTYHHGNLRRALIDAALAAVAERGPGALSLRELAGQVGVSHAAPAHHFGDKAGLLTVVAAEGYELLAGELERAGDFLEAGLAYVRFATRNPAYFQVMFRPDLYRPDDPAVEAGRARTSAVLYGTAGGMPVAGDPLGDRSDRSDRSDGSARQVGVAGWCLMHGLATLWLTGNLRALGDDPVELARSVASVTFRGEGP